MKELQKCTNRHSPIIFIGREWSDCPLCRARYKNEILERELMSMRADVVLGRVQRCLPPAPYREWEDVHA